MGYGENFTKWQLYVHYLLLDAFISVFAVYFGAPLSWTMFFQLYALLFVGDSIVHAIFWFLPEKYGRWRD